MVIASLRPQVARDDTIVSFSGCRRVESLPDYDAEVVKYIYPYFLEFRQVYTYSYYKNESEFVRYSFTPKLSI